MNFVTLKDILPQALKKHTAVGHFNYNGILWGQAMLEVAEEEKSPIIIATSDRVVDDLGGFEAIQVTVKSLMKQLKITVPVVLHLDHGQTVERCMEAVDAGYSSVMYDGSRFEIAENIERTKMVVQYAQKVDCSVEAEVGAVGGNEDGLIGGIQYAKLEDCVQLVEKTQVDALAAALGSVHGRYGGEPNLGFKEMKEISSATNIPLVLHGASGIPTEQVKQAIQLGHAKVNVNTELNIAWVAGLKEAILADELLYEPKKVQEIGKENIKKAVREKIQEFSSI